MGKVFLVIISLVALGYSAPEDLLLSRKNVSVLSAHQLTLQESSVVLYEGKSSFGYGILVSAEGEILTKASLLHSREDYKVRLGKKEYEPEFISESREWDVALIKIPLEEGKAISFSEELPTQGDIIVSNGVTSLLKRRLKFGVISATTREIPVHVSTLDFLAYPDEEDRFLVEAVKEEGKAEEKGMEKGDIVLSIDGVALDDPEKPISDLYEGKWPGDVAKVVIQRDGKEETLEIPFLWKHEVAKGPQDRNEAMSGRISGRRMGFPKVLQHDIALTRKTVGGPLLNLEGKCIGMNIARFSRAETFAIPAAELKTILKGLRSE